MASNIQSDNTVLVFDIHWSDLRILPDNVDIAVGAIPIYYDNVDLGVGETQIDKCIPHLFSLSSRPYISQSYVHV